MPVGKNSISRMTRAAAEAKESHKTSGIRSLAPEVPAGDAAPKKTTQKKTPTKASGTKSVAKKMPSAAKAATTATLTEQTPKVAPIGTYPAVRVGEALPVWLL